MKCLRSEILFGDQAIQSLVATVAQANSAGAQIVVLLDENTHQNCWPMVEGHFVDCVVNLMIMGPGEESKSIEYANELWNEMLDQGADRHSILINIGGGVVTDLGGFVASTYKRGVRFINMPTSLMAMADAAIGGKTGIDLGSSKNQVGTFAWPSHVLILPEFLKTLPEQEKLSGWAECLKHGLLHSEELFNQVSKSLDSLDEQLIRQVIRVKVDTVEADPNESGIRKSLNFGHTVGHAIESSCMENGEAIPHGFAVALGILAELKIGEELFGLNLDLTSIWEKLLDQHFSESRKWKAHISELETYMASDKKSVGGQLRFSLLSDFGDCWIDQPVTDDQLRSGLQQLNSWLAK